MKNKNNGRGKRTANRRCAMNRVMAVLVMCVYLITGTVGTLSVAATEQPDGVVLEDTQADYEVNELTSEVNEDADTDNANEESVSKEEQTGNDPGTDAAEGGDPVDPYGAVPVFYENDLNADSGLEPDEADEEYALHKIYVRNGDGEYLPIDGDTITDVYAGDTINILGVVENAENVGNSGWGGTAFVFSSANGFTDIKTGYEQMSEEPDRYILTASVEIAASGSIWLACQPQGEDYDLQYAVLGIEAKSKSFYVKNDTGEFAAASTSNVKAGEEYEIMAPVGSTKEGYELVSAQEGLIIDQNSIEWIQSITGNWRVKAKIKATENGRYTLVLRNGNSGEILSLAVNVSGMITINNIKIGHKIYSDKDKDTATRMLNAKDDRSGGMNMSIYNSSQFPYPVYVHEQLDLQINADGCKLVLGGDTDIMKPLESGTSFIAQKPGTCVFDLVNSDGRIMESLYVTVEYPIYIQTTLGEYHKDNLNEYLENAWQVNSPKMFDPNGLPLYIKNCYEYPMIMYKGNSVELVTYVSESGEDWVNNDDTVELTNSQSTDNNGFTRKSVTVTACKEGRALVSFGGVNFFIEVRSSGNSNVNHFDIEIADGSTYRFRTTVHHGEGSPTIIEKTYNAYVEDINFCDVFDANGKLLIDKNDKDHSTAHTIEKYEYWKNEDTSEEDTQHEITSAYPTVKAEGDDEGKQYGVRIYDPFVKERAIAVEDIDHVVFNLDLRLEDINAKGTELPLDEINSMAAYDSSNNFIDNLIQQIKDKDWSDVNKGREYVMNATDILTAINKCPNHSGGDFTLNDMENTDVYFGALTVTKKVDPNDAVEVDSTKKFTFTITLDGEVKDVISASEVTGMCGDIEFINGVATFTLTDGESKTARDLPAGLTYTVEEAENKNYEVSWTGAKGVIGENSVSTATATNKRKTGNLEVKKTVIGEGADLDKNFKFRITLDPGDEKLSGSYPYDVAMDGEIAPEMKGTLSFKEEEAEGHTVYVADIELKHGQSIIIYGLPVGIQYEVTENSVSNYEVSWTGAKGVIDENNASTATATNTFKKPETGSKEETKPTPEPSSEAETTSEPETSSEEETTSEPETSSEAEITSEPETSSEEEMTSEPETSSEEETTPVPETSGEEETTPIPEMSSEEETTPAQTGSEEETTPAPETGREEETTEGAGGMYGDGDEGGNFGSREETTAEQSAAPTTAAPTTETATGSTEVVLGIEDHGMLIGIVCLIGGGILLLGAGLMLIMKKKNK